MVIERTQELTMSVTYECDGHITRREGYVKLPEKRDYSPEEWVGLKLCRLNDAREIILEAAARGEKFPTIMELEFQKKKYEDDKDAYALIEAFLLCRQANIFPSDWVLEGLFNRFDGWKRSNISGNSRPLDDFFPTGEKPKWRERSNEPVYSELYHGFLWLKRYWGLLNPKIYQVLAERLKANGTDSIGVGEHFKRKVNDRLIIEIRKEQNWAKEYKLDKKFGDAHKPCLTQNEADGFLQTFPLKSRSVIQKYKKREPTGNYYKHIPLTAEELERFFATGELPAD